MKRFMIIIFLVAFLFSQDIVHQNSSSRKVGTKEVSASIQVKIIIPARKIVDNNLSTDSTKLTKPDSSLSLTQTD